MILILEIQCGLQGGHVLCSKLLIEWEAQIILLLVILRVTISDRVSTFQKTYQN